MKCTGHPPGSRGGGPRRRFVLLALWLVAGTALAGSPQIVVIGAPGSEMSGLTVAELARIFRRKLPMTPAGRPLVPVNLTLTDPLRSVFSRAVFGLDPDAMETYWTERYFHGVSPPHVVASSEAMLRFVHATPGAIGYVWSCEVDDRVQVLLRLPLSGAAAQVWAGHCGAPSPAP